MKRTQNNLGRTLTLFCALSAGCVVVADDDDPSMEEEERVYTLCGDEMTEGEMAEFINGNLVILARYSEDGQSKSGALANLVVSLVANGIDFSSLGSARPSFTDGRYALETGDSELAFQLTAAEAFGEVEAGELIPYNVFAVDSYAQNIRTELDTSTVPPTASVLYDPGPLAGLVEGEIDIDATSLDVAVRLHTEFLDIEVDSTSAFGDVWVSDDELVVQMTSSRVNMAALAGDLEAAGFGFSYDGTAYESPAESLSQEFFDSEFLTIRRDNGNYTWEGNYRSTVIKADTTMHQSGFVSTEGGNYTEYYCDPELTQRAGVAEHHDSLLGGYFVFPNGDRFVYGII